MGVVKTRHALWFSNSCNEKLETILSNEMRKQELIYGVIYGVTLRYKDWQLGKVCMIQFEEAKAG